ncbi:MAG TPA: 50S ribosomal protein L11 methyltransferase [Vicinamibacterales bacterium]|nr:50S ribosomal protein L11 methyltransferase [Vicinamibacterales bacterium]
MSRFFPALDVSWSTPPDDDAVDRLLATIDDERPIAVETRDGGVRIFFLSSGDRERAGLRASAYHAGVVCTPVDVPDEHWAERSQAALEPVEVGGLIVTPPWREAEARARRGRSGAPLLVVIIQPSMGFGTGHHATTRLCLNLMQRQSLMGARVVDVGTGSGVLAIAAAALGATDVVAIDSDPDALQSATENIGLNRADAVVQPRLADLGLDGASLSASRPFDLVLANLTGAVLERYASVLADLVAPGGSLIVSGCLADEAPNVERAFETMKMERSWREQADEWVALAFTNPSASTTR